MTKHSRFTFFLVLTIGLISSFTLTIFSQEIKTPEKFPPVAVNKLTKKMLPVPSDLSNSSASFFTFSLKSISQIEIQLFDSDKQPLSKVIINENVIDDLIEYKISTSDTDVEWVKITRSSKENKDVTNVLSSSGKNLEIITAMEENKGVAQLKNQYHRLKYFLITLC